jgi:predicted nucleotidyltransferase
MNKQQNIILEKLYSAEFKKYLSSMGLNSVLVFGSLLTNNFNEASDVDIAILSNSKLKLKDILDLELYLENILNRNIDVIDLNSETLDIFIKKDILNTGKVIYSQDSNKTLEKLIDDLDWYFKENETFFYFRRRDLLS